jgi:type I restriction enzyme S subunit
MAGKYKTYPEYKDTGVTWLPSIPTDWQVLPLKLASANKVKDGPHETPIFLDEGVPFFSVDGIQGNKLAFDGCRYISREDHKRYSQKCLPKFGDVLLGKAASVGKVAFVDTKEEFNVWSPLAVLTPKSPKLGRFIYYCLQSTWLQAQCDVNSNSNTQKNLSMGDIDNLLFAIPSDDVSNQIARFLDHETAKIDTLIDKQQQLIKLLKEKRQAVISHAVTKGLNPNAPMRDSGVEWLGEVPAHWKVRRFKFLVTESSAGPYGSSLTKAMYTSAGVRVFGQQQVIPNDFSIGDYYISEEKYLEMKRYSVSPGDVLISVMGTVGKVAVVPNNIEPGIINPRLVKYRVREDSLLPEFVRASILSMPNQTRLSFFAQGSTMDGLNMQIIGELPILYPSIEEQSLLLGHMKVLNEEFDHLLTLADGAISLLQERRTALIYAAVTGKIAVRNWATPEPQPTEAAHA